MTENERIENLKTKIGYVSLSDNVCINCQYSKFDLLPIDWNCPEQTVLRCHFKVDLPFAVSNDDTCNKYEERR